MWPRNFNDYLLPKTQLDTAHRRSVNNKNIPAYPYPNLKLEVINDEMKSVLDFLYSNKITKKHVQDIGTKLKTI